MKNCHMCNKKVKTMSTLAQKVFSTAVSLALEYILGQEMVVYEKLNNN